MSRTQSPHLTLTLSPPIGMGAEREQQAEASCFLICNSWEQVKRLKGNFGGTKLI